MVNKRVDPNIKNDMKYKVEQIQQSQQYSSPDENDYQVAATGVTNTNTKNRKNKAIVEKENNNKVHEIIVNNNNNNSPVSSPKNRRASPPLSPKLAKKPEGTIIPSNRFVTNLNLVRGIGIFFFIYYIAMMYVRYQHRGITGFADTLWLCNLSIVFGFISIAINRPFMMAIACNCCLIVHFLWVVDITWYFIVGVFPLGNAEYISWPDITWGEIITTTHHAWFVPLCMLCLNRNGGYPRKAWIGSLCCILPTVYLSQLFPKILAMPDGSNFYLNINMAHEWWSDMKGWPFSLVPKEPKEYYIFLFAFSGVLFTVAHVLMKLVCYATIKKR